MISNLHYISQGADAKKHLKNIEIMLQAGANWVQLRLKDYSEDELFQTAGLAKILCKKFDAKLIINDHPQIAREVNADGVHLGKEDMCPIEAREILGKHKIIGGTANTLEDCELLLTKKMDYIGLGPLRFTNTKKKLSPILGFSGYEELMNQYLKNSNAVPIIAIGGIVNDDIPLLKNCGIYGIAISGMLTNSMNPEVDIRKIYKELED
ncbi:MAG: thiamine phosphate synthase [Thalassobius sp.]|nr:thiamine phosphate synthase [Thalassovita sp.]